MVDLRQNKDSEAPYNPFNDGWDERVKKIRRSDNPFPNNNWKHYEWRDGWDGADEAIKEESKT